MAHLEHLNVTVSNPQAMADMLITLFGWHIRWEGTAINGGHTIHVGSDDAYVAVYTGPDGGRNQAPADTSFLRRGGLNHIGVVVDDLAAVEARVKALGFTPTNHGDYEPGKRFYFRGYDDIEIEVVCYA